MVRRVIGILAILAAVVLAIIVVVKVVNGTFTGEISTSILYAAFSLLLLTFGIKLLVG